LFQKDRHTFRKMERKMDRENGCSAPADGRSAAASHQDVVDLIPALRAFATGFERRRPQADDLVQETLMRALQALHQYDAGSSLKSWLFTIMKNAHYASYNRNKREPVGQDMCVSMQSVAEKPNQEWSVVFQETCQFLDKMQPDRRAALLLVSMGETYEDAADLSDCEIGTIRSRVNRARQELLRGMNEGQKMTGPMM
jgi:RNA polymerase sigma-70 factor, ECF subfamily